MLGAKLEYKNGWVKVVEGIYMINYVYPMSELQIKLSSKSKPIKIAAIEPFILAKPLVLKKNQYFRYVGLC